MGGGGGGRTKSIGRGAPTYNLAKTDKRNSNLDLVLRGFIGPTSNYLPVERLGLSFVFVL